MDQSLVKTSIVVTENYDTCSGSPIAICIESRKTCCMEQYRARHYQWYKSMGNINNAQNSSKMYFFGLHNNSRLYPYSGYKDMHRLSPITFLIIRRLRNLSPIHVVNTNQRYRFQTEYTAQSLASFFWYSTIVDRIYFMFCIGLVGMNRHTTVSFWRGW